MYETMHFECPHCGAAEGMTKKIHQTFDEGERINVRGRCRQCAGFIITSFIFAPLSQSAEETDSNPV